MIETHNLTIGYESKIIQSNLNIVAGENRLICLVGTNGTGKTTLLKTIAGLIPALEGKVEIDNTDLTTLDNYHRAKMIAITQTNTHTVSDVMVREVVELGRYPHTNLLGQLTADDNRSVDNAMLLTHIEPFTSRTYNSLSDGEKQRTLIAQTIAQDTKNILFDEPTAHLDIPNKINIMLLLQQLAHRQNKTIICTTHDLNLALQTAAELWVMTREGLKQGTPTQLLEKQILQQAFSQDNYTLVQHNNVIEIRFNQNATNHTC